jgi:hypothetical protein
VDVDVIMVEVATDVQVLEAQNIRKRGCRDGCIYGSRLVHVKLLL